MGEQKPQALLERGYEFQRASISELWDEAQDLIQANHEETGALPREYFRPEKASYEEIERRGASLTFSMRRPGGVLAGYSVFFTLAHLHYPGILMAYQDVLYVRPEDRGPHVLHFIAYQDRELERLGVKAVIRHVKPHRDYSHLLVSLGYGRHEISYLRVFGNGH